MNPNWTGLMATCASVVMFANIYGEAKRYARTRRILLLVAMVGVKLGAMGHFIAVLARDGDQLTVNDPLTGLRTMTLKDLEKHCKLTGFHLSITRDR
ncbi:MAG: hypothetical protein WCS43_02095 [Verrucomicrobiota bacterium]